MVPIATQLSHCYRGDGSWPGFSLPYSLHSYSVSPWLMSVGKRFFDNPWNAKLVYKLLHLVLQRQCICSPLLGQSMSAEDATPERRKRESSCGGRIDVDILRLVYMVYIHHHAQNALMS